jgi:porphobilinogen deaminase
MSECESKEETGTGKICVTCRKSSMVVEKLTSAIIQHDLVVDMDITLYQAQ